MPPTDTGTQATGVDVRRELQKLVSDAGTVTAEYGGFEIRVDRPETFPWTRVMLLLTSVGQDIWVERDRDGTLLVVSKPPST